MSPTRGIPTSRAFWECKADQVLNRVFEPETAAETAIEVEVVERPPEPPAPSAYPTPERNRPAWLGEQPGLMLAGIGITALIAAGASLLLVGLWGHSQQALRQERNLLLLERLRNLGPVAAEPAATSTPASGDGLPPPPPHEPWMQELARLPSSGAPAAEPLRVPVNERITSPPPDASGSGGGGSPGASGGSAPQLLGVVQVPGRAGSAIFQVGGSSTSAGVGESIGSSGWRLLSASGDSAVIERSGEQRRLSISSGF